MSSNTVSYKEHLIIRSFVMQSGLVRLLQFFHELHKRFFVDEADVLSVAQNAHIAQAELDEALIYEVDWRMDIQSHRRLPENKSAYVHGSVTGADRTYRIHKLREIRGRRPIISLHVGPTTVGCETRHQTHGILFIFQFIKRKFQFRGRNETNENLLAEYWKAPVEFSSHEQNIQFLAELSGGNQWGIRDINNAVLSETRD